MAPRLIKAETDRSALPLIIEYAGGELLADIQGDKARHEESLVFGRAEDKPWAQKYLPAGKRVFDRTTLINGVLRGQLDLSSPLFII